MIRNIIIGLVVLIVIAVAVVVGLHYWNKYNAPTPSSATGETEIQIAEVDQGLEGVPEPGAEDVDFAPDMPATEPEETPSEIVPDTEPPADTGAEEPEITIEEPMDVGSPQPIVSEGPSGTEGQTREITAPDTGDTSRPTRPVEGEQTEPPVATPTATPPTTTPTELETTPAEETGTTPETDTIPETPTQPPVSSGNYRVRTLTPVLESALPGIRKAMNALGAPIQAQKAGQSGNIQAYRVAVGYFRTKQEATSWAQNYFRPKGIEYYVYPAQGMYSIQVGVYAQRQNVDIKMRELYNKFPGWRLPVRTEMTTLSKTLYHLSTGWIAEALARKVQNKLVQMGVNAELVGR